MKQTLTLWNPQQGHQVFSGVWPSIKAMLMAGRRITVEVKEQKRSLAENNMLHAMLGEISRQVDWAGKKRDPETWKRLMTAAWCRASGEAVEFLPAIDGNGVDIVFRRTSDLSRSECADLISFIQAWCAEAGVELSQ